MANVCLCSVGWWDEIRAARVGCARSELSCPAADNWVDCAAESSFGT